MEIILKKDWDRHNNRQRYKGVEFKLDNLM
jgi:hypothetical protein